MRANLFEVNNTTLDGRYKWFWYVWIEILHFLWLITPNDGIFLQNNTFKSFYVKRREARIFWLARFIYSCLDATEEEKRSVGIIIKNDKI